MALFIAFPQCFYGAGKADSVPARERSAQVKILSLQEEQKELYLKISDPKMNDLERSRRISDHISRYENLVLEFPQNTSLEILYAKFLRDIGEDEKAKILFEAAEKRAPEYAVIQQQLGAISAEEGDFEKAFPRLKKAVELQPGNVTYNFQFGEFLSTFRTMLIEKKIFNSAEAIDSAIQDAFRACVAIEPENIDLNFRYAMSFYDIASPDWREALNAWENVKILALKSENKAGTKNAKELFLESINLHKARVLAELGSFDDAKKLLLSSKSTEFEHSRDEIRKIISQKNKTF